MSDNPDLELVVRKLHSDVEQILGVVMPLMQDVAVRGLQADKLDAAIDRLDAGQGRLDAAIGRLEAGQERIEAGQTKLRVDVMARMDRLQARMDNLDEHLKMGLGHADDAVTLARSAIDSSRTHGEQIRSLEKLLLKLEARVNQLEDKQQ